MSFDLLDGGLLGESIALDLLWHGERPESAEPLTLELLADDLVEQIPGALDLVGVSLGGTVAQYAALRHPTRVRSLLLAATTAGDGSPELERQLDERAEMTMAVGMAGLLDWALPRWFTPAALSQADHPGVDYVRDRLLRDDPRSVAEGWRAMGHSDTAGRLSQIAVPATVLHPDQDVTPLAAKEELAEGLPTAECAWSRDRTWSTSSGQKRSRRPCSSIWRGPAVPASPLQG